MWRKWFSWSKTDSETNLKFLSRRMKNKLSIYKCLDCEKRSKSGLPYLFHKICRGNKCPVCGSSRVRKISISAVIELRWNRCVKKQLDFLHVQEYQPRPVQQNA